MILHALSTIRAILDSFNRSFTKPLGPSNKYEGEFLTEDVFLETLYN